jgi:hypothetical protein
MIKFMMNTTQPTVVLRVGDLTLLRRFARAEWKSGCYVSPHKAMDYCLHMMTGIDNAGIDWLRVNFQKSLLVTHDGVRQS